MYSEEQAFKILQKRVSRFPELLVMLGSGWNAVLDEAVIEQVMDYEELLGVGATVPGHVGKLVVAKVGGKRAALMQGRVHMYEGFLAYEATMPIRLFAKAGMKKLVTTAAVGAVNEKYRVGDFVLLTDLITLFLSMDNPLKGPQFLDMSEVFEVKMRKIARKIMVELELPYREGTYMYLHGPNYETPADKMALKFLGADVVGMSTVPEAMMARWLKVQVLGLAFVTNLAFVKHDHKEVVETAERSRESMKRLLTELVKRV